MMMNPPETIEEARAYRYGAWSGNPNGRGYMEGNCAYEAPIGGTFRHRQCARPNGSKLAPLYCAMHARKVTK